jgi:hypothetical protein
MEFGSKVYLPQTKRLCYNGGWIACQKTWGRLARQSRSTLLFRHILGVAYASKAKGGG